MRGIKGVCLIAAVAAVCFASVHVARAEGTTHDKFELQQIVVTATKTEKRVEDAPGSVTVIDQEELKSQDIQTVDDALDSLAGVFVKRTKGLMDSTPSLRMRGFNGDQYTLVLLDGQPLNDAYTGGVSWGSLPVENIDRIEVIRGAASALYGGNAMGGVVNIITKTPQKPEFEAGGGYGTHDTWRYHMSAGTRFRDRFSLRVGYEGEGTDGYAATPVLASISSGPGNVPGGYPMNDKYGDPTKWVVGDKGENGAERKTLNGKLSLDFSETGQLSLSAFSGRHEYDYGAPNSYMGTLGDNSTYAISGPSQRARFRPNDFINYTGIGKTENDTCTLAFDEIFGTVHFNAQAGTVQVDDRYTLESGSGLDDYNNSEGSLKVTKNESWFTELRGDMPIGSAHIMSLGTSYRTDESDTNDYEIPFYRSYDDTGESTFYSGGDSKTWALFAQDEWRIADPLTLYLGLRYDSWKVYDGASGVPGAMTCYESNTESQLSPKISAVWKAYERTTFKASAGHAFRPPTLYELYRTWESWGTIYQSNPNLKPETVWTYEMGIEQSFLDGKTRVSMTGYRNDIEDLIYYRTDGSTKLRTNAGEARTYGLEIQASHQLMEWLSLWCNYTYTNAEITESPMDPASEGKQVTGIPENTFNAGIDTRYKWFRGSLVGRYFSKIYNDSDNRDTAEGVYSTYEPAFFMDAKITVIPLRQVEVSLCVDNILDEEYYEYYKSDGRTFFAEFTLRY